MRDSRPTTHIRDSRRRRANTAARNRRIPRPRLVIFAKVTARPQTCPVDPSATLDDRREAVEILESVTPVWTRIYGEAHPETPKVQGALKDAREILARALASAPPAAGGAEEKS